METTNAPAPAAPTPATDAAPPADAPQPTGENQATPEGDQPAGDGAPAAPAADAKPAPAPEPRETALRAQLHQRERQLAAKEADLAERETKAKLPDAERTELEALRALKSGAKTDIMGALEALGLTPEDIFKATKEGRAPLDPAAKKALERVEKLEKEAAERKEAETKARDAADRQAVRVGLGQVIKSEGDRFEFLLDEGDAGVEALTAVIEEFGTRNKRAPTLDEVKKLGDLVEKDYRANYDRKSNTKYAKSKSAPPAPKPAEDAEPETPRGLSNDMEARPTKPPEKKRKLSHQQELEENMREAGITFSPAKPWVPPGEGG